MTSFPKKDAKTRYVDMAIFIDKTVYTENKDDEKTYDYLCLLYQMLARKGKFFKSSEDYENFAYVSATRMFYRLVNPKQFLPDGDPKKLKKIKSCLNYIQMTLQASKVDYQRQFFNQILDPQVMLDNNTEGIRGYVHDKAKETSSQITQIEITEYINHISDTIWGRIKYLPYKTNKALLRRIYISCLLSFLNEITWSKELKEKTENRFSNQSVPDAYIDAVYKKNQINATRLFHIDPQMKAYIMVQTNAIKKLVKKDICSLISSNEPTDEIIKSMLINSMDSKDSEN